LVDSESEIMCQEWSDIPTHIYSGFLHQLNWPPRYNWNTVESDAKHHNPNFNNISVISWQSFLLMEKTGVPRENHQPVASHWQTLSHNVLWWTYWICTGAGVPIPILTVAVRPEEKNEQIVFKHR
jgi:hypothetical protein